jgi:ABC-type branched-subunit amino acid transport system ATPase component/MFS family permease
MGGLVGGEQPTSSEPSDGSTTDRVTADSERAPRSDAAAAVDELEATEELLRQESRTLLGIGVTEAGGSPPFFATLRSTGGWYPLAALGGLGGVLLVQSVAFNLYSPEIAHSLGLDVGTIASLTLFKTLAIAVTSLLVATYVQRRQRRAKVAIAAGLAWGVSIMVTAYAVNRWYLLASLLVNGVATGGMLTVQGPLVVDTYPSGVRIRSFSILWASVVGGWVATAVLVVLCSGPLDLTWRAAFFILGLITFVLALFGIRLRDSGSGQWDMARVRQVVQGSEEPTNVLGEQASDVRAVDDHASEDHASEDKVTRLGFFETFRVILLVPGVRIVLPLASTFGIFLQGFGTYIQMYLQERWDVGVTERGVLTCILPLLALPALVWFAKRGEGVFRRDPSKFLGLGSAVIVAASLLLAIAVLVPVFGVMVALLILSFAAFFVIGPLMYVIGLSIVHPSNRGHMAALLVIAFGAGGGTAGTVALSGIGSRFGISGAIMAMALLAVGAGGAARQGMRSVNTDIDRVVHGMVEAEELRVRYRNGQQLPLLACRHVDFSYGTVQVLFDVSFTVDEGEMIALLGTNGSGKSTLLRAISGLGMASRGTIHLQGADITHLDPERRVGLGIIQVPGGRSVFRSMSVIDNLRVFGQTRRRDRQHIERAIDTVFETFPSLAGRRNALASTLSGGQQQMLALGRTFILEPRVLLIDELSLGLAPVVVGRLLEMVKQINRAGTAVVLVEQSVNIALTTVDHAYYMERGQIRFDGAASELLERGDLLRSVFLEGAVRGLSKTNEGGGLIGTEEGRT